MTTNQTASGPRLPADVVELVRRGEEIVKLIDAYVDYDAARAALGSAPFRELDDILEEMSDKIETFSPPDACKLMTELAGNDEERRARLSVLGVSYLRHIFRYDPESLRRSLWAWQGDHAEFLLQD